MNNLFVIDYLNVNEATESGVVVNGDVNVESSGNLNIFNNGKCQLLNNNSGNVEIDTSGTLFIISSENADNVTLLEHGNLSYMMSSYRMWRMIRL